MQETQEMQVQSLSWEDFLKKEMATHSSILAWKISWTEEGPWSRKESETIEHACSIIQRHTLNRLGNKLTQSLFEILHEHTVLGKKLECHRPLAPLVRALLLSLPLLWSTLWPTSPAKD